MKTLLCAFGILAGSAGLVTPVEAQNYPWCAYYSGKGGRNCGFVSYSQCMATAMGAGAFCMVNTQYEPVTRSPGPYYVPHARYHGRHYRHR